MACGQYHSLVSVRAVGAFLGEKRLRTIRYCVPRATARLEQLVGTVGEEIIKQIACGYYHTCITTVEEMVHTFGRNDYGQLGQYQNTRTPSHVTLLDDHSIIDITF